MFERFRRLFSFTPGLSIVSERNLIYGDGSDGASSTTGFTQTQSKFYNSLDHTGTGNVVCNNWTFFVRGAMRFKSTGVFVDSIAARNASGSSGGTSSAQQSLSPVNAGSAGITTATTATAGANGVGLTGDQGGGGLSGGTTAATGSHSQVYGRCLAIFYNLALGQLAPAAGIAGLQSNFGTSAIAGRGSGDGTNAGGGSGCCGGAIFVAFRLLYTAVAGAVYSAVGGNGGNGAAGTAGGGGAGGGGGIMTVYGSAIGTAPTDTLTGGTGGTGQGGAGNGGNGVAGSNLHVTNV